MKHILTFENFTSVPKAVAIEQEMTLMDKPLDKEIAEEEKKELLKDEEEETNNTKKVSDAYKTKKHSSI